MNRLMNTRSELKDIIVVPEVTVWSELLGFGGTADALVFHADGRASITDYKTGSHFGVRTTTDSMNYGNQDIYISDNQRERAKLQVMTYAFLFKLNNPKLKFKNLTTVWIPNQFMIQREDTERFVEVQSYLRMIEAFLKDKAALKKAGMDPDIYNKILEQSPRIFDVSEYTDKAPGTLFENLKDGVFNPEEEYRKRILEITLILGRLRNQRQIRVEELPESEKERLAKLYEEIAAMRADPSMQLDVYVRGGIGSYDGWELFRCKHGCVSDLGKHKKRTIQYLYPTARERSSGIQKASQAGL
ncbi:MAG: hypothetical protein HC945_04515, partial [Nitrosarchaeum sp.]|nr:hypothetical protein [Nitrosarchaeum sp.]